MKRITTHVTDADLLLALDHELTPERSTLVEEHLAACAPCRGRRDALSATMTAVNDSIAGDGPSFHAGASRARLDAMLREAALTPDPSWLARWGLTPSPQRIRAGLLLAISAALVVLWMARPRDGSIDEAPMALPVPSLTPGAVADLTATELCAGVRPPRDVSDAARLQVLRAYRMEHVSAGAYELDALITPELGGTAEPRNLWPQMYDSPVWNAHVKDQLEDLLSAMVCRQEIALARAQHDIAHDWVLAYKQYFKTDAPLQAHVVRTDTSRFAVLVHDAGTAFRVEPTLHRR